MGRLENTYTTMRGESILERSSRDLVMQLGGVFIQPLLFGTLLFSPYRYMCLSVCGQKKTREYEPVVGK